MSYVHPEYLIEVEELRTRLDGTLHIFDATVFLTRSANGMAAESGLAKYNEAHIPGAAFLDLIEALSDTTSGLGFTLPTPEALQMALRQAGVRNDTEIVVYSAGSIMWATRAWWLLNYAGHDRVRVLNGGLAAWLAARAPTTSEPTTYAAGNFEISPRAHRFADRDAVLAAVGDPNVCTINALTEAMYTGAAPINYGRKGHITGSRNLAYDALLTEERFNDGSALQTALKGQGMLSDGPVITYCGGGIAATVDAFACLLMGKEDVAVYDGSLSEWVRDEALPMTEGADAG